MDSNDNFEYFLSAKGDLLIITLIGDVKSATKEKLSACIEEVKSYDKKYGVLYTRDIMGLENKDFPDFSQFIYHLRRAFPEGFKICSLRPDYRVLLHQNEVASNEEFTNNLKDTALDFINGKKDNGS